MSTDPEGDLMMAHYASDIRHENALKYAERVTASPETFHEDEVLLAEAITTLRAANKRWMDDYCRMNSMHEHADKRAEAAEQALATECERSDCLVREIEALRKDAELSEAACAVLVAFCERIRNASAGRDWKPLFDQTIEWMKEANALCEAAPTAAVGLLKRLEEAERALAEMRELHEMADNGLAVLMNALGGVQTVAEAQRRIASLSSVLTSAQMREKA